ncbi:LysR family transcriptional regulator [Cupriavidus sp. CV2]|nr:LysR family transcriptional regulator [Cupriavidus sp. CV2]MDW3683816.1 LysR family transcriptional regulator [Cupriavidus sp. CV2]
MKRTTTTASRSDDEGHLTAYNAAFTELGLRFRWDAGMYHWLCGIECEKTRVARYIEEYHAHLLRAYDADFLSQPIFDKKNEYLRARGRQAN